MGIVERVDLVLGPEHTLAKPQRRRKAAAVSALMDGGDCRVVAVGDLVRSEVLPQRDSMSVDRWPSSGGERCRQV